MSMSKGPGLERILFLANVVKREIRYSMPSAV